jgi:hypothetical protein
MKAFHISNKCDKPSSELMSFAVSQSKTKAIGSDELHGIIPEFYFFPSWLSAVK